MSEPLDIRTRIVSINSDQFAVMQGDMELGFLIPYGASWAALDPDSRVIGVYRTRGEAQAVVIARDGWTLAERPF